MTDKTEAISPLIGVALMIIIIVALATIIAVFVYSMAGALNQTQQEKETVHDITAEYYEDGLKDGLNGTMNKSRQNAGSYRQGYFKGIDLKYCRCDGVDDQ